MLGGFVDDMFLKWIAYMLDSEYDRVSESVQVPSYGLVGNDPKP